MRAALAALHPPEPRHPFPPRDPSRPKGFNVLGLFALHPALATAYHTFNGHILFATTLTVRQRELLVLRVAYRRDGEYEWAQHAVLAGDADITADEVERIRRPSITEADGWSRLDAGVLQAADELLDDARIGDDTWAALATDLDPQQILDLIFTVGAYDVLAMALRSFDVPLDDDLMT